MDEIDPMESIFHEKQEGSLCAQHCLNALLQGQYFTAVELAAIGQQLDEEERRQMAEAGEESEAYQQFLKQPSSNFDDSGFFSIQVIQKAVTVWAVELVPFTSSHPVAVATRDDPRSQKAYICNFREHWFTIRKLGQQWFNLNSLLVYPELVSDTYLDLFLKQLQNEGYSIFVVIGSLPEAEAEQILNLIPAVQKIKPSLITDKHKSPGSSSGAAGSSGSSVNTFEDEDLQRALEASRRLIEDEDETLKQALAMSMQDVPPDFSFPVESLSGSSTQSQVRDPPPTDKPEDIRQKRLAHFQRQADGTEMTEPSDESECKVSELSEEDMLKMALKMSMDEGNSDNKSS